MKMTNLKKGMVKIYTEAKEDWTGLFVNDTESPGLFIQDQ